MQVGISGFSEEVTEADIHDVLSEYGCTVLSVKIHDSEDKHRRLAMVDIDTDHSGAKMLAEKIDGLVWRGTTLHSETFLFGNK